ncbi:RNA polymerase sigma factor [Salinibacillus xinjiangensis]|uniref:Sigma-70 family RNA polymerase sigma factor n=1 Tax=Salinibacillus xinjiangensis TaxID=1229268 RepID=A0A6G1X462_9BACI|nr:sigma-70 family RNA polymerase sigma factor [Salinibacillus xinjiangensis]MRG85732.1 sigma-70 family RNA polymerase sigma factor [Salinibacillus xinjiangensis]
MLAFQKGEEGALDRVYLLMKPSIYTFIYRYTRDEQLSIDIVQDTFEKLQNYKQDFDPQKGKLKSYLFQMAYRIMITKLNRRKKWRSLLPFLAPLEKEDYHHEDRMTIRDAITKLPDKHRAVILLFYYHDMSQEEIGEILNIPSGTVKSRLHHAIKRLKEELGVDYYESRSL